MPEILSQQTETKQEKLRESISELIETERTYVARLITTYKVKNLPHLELFSNIICYFRFTWLVARIF